MEFGFILSRAGHAFVLVFSISSKQSLTELKPILELITEVKGNLEDIPLVLVGNKNDEEAGAREVPYKTGETLQVKKEVCTFCDKPADLLLSATGNVEVHLY